MAPKLYAIDASPPVRSVVLLAKTLNVELEIGYLNLLEKEQYSDAFLKLNPQHTVPTLVLEDGRSLWESCAILHYLVNKYNGNSYYPEDPYEAALVEQRLHFNSNTLFPLLKSIARPIIYGNQQSFPQEKTEEVNNNYSLIEKFLQGHNWIAGKKITIADYSLITTVTNAHVLVPVDGVKFPNVAAWIKRCQGLPHFQYDQLGVDMFRKLVKLDS